MARVLEQEAAVQLLDDLKRLYDATDAQGKIAIQGALAEFLMWEGKCPGRTDS